MAVSATACLELRREALNSLEETPEGVTLYDYGSPSSGQLYKVTQIYG